METVLIPASIKKRFLGWTARRDIALLLHVVLYAASLAYGAAVRMRLMLYRAGFFTTKRLGCKVVSIGNITVGGTGKTPVTMFVAETLKRQGHRVVVISRGYGRARSGLCVVSDGRDILASPEEAGDEPLMMASRLDGVPVIVGVDRVGAGRYAEEKFSPRVIVLDDGFQHLRLERDLDIVLVDSSRGFGNGFLLPRGILREPVEALERADIVMVKGESAAFDGLSSTIGRFSYVVSALKDLDGKNAEPPESIKGKRLTAICAIADPDSFFAFVRRAGAEIVNTLVFPDHHAYDERDVEEIRRAALETDLVVTTEKDAVKLKRFKTKLPATRVIVINVVCKDLLSLLEKIFV